MIKNIIFDFGKVLVDFDPYYMTKQYFNNEEEIKLVSNIIFDRLYWDKLDKGGITDAEIKNDVKQRLPVNLIDNAFLAYDNWYRNLPEINGMREIVTELKSKGYKLYLLSNISKQFVENYAKVESIVSLFELFDGLVFSGPIEMVKPNKDIFEYLLNKFSINAEESVFIDDNVSNINGAKKVGINTYLFDGNSKNLRKYLNLI